MERLTGHVMREVKFVDRSTVYCLCSATSLYYDQFHFEDRVFDEIFIVGKEYVWCHHVVEVNRRSNRRNVRGVRIQDMGDKCGMQETLHKVIQN